MFSTQRFGGYLSRLRKKADMTQSELADKLNITRQAVSRYETGDSFPDVSILVIIAEVFGVTLDELINSGEPTGGELQILENVSRGKSDVKVSDVSDIVNLAPYLKPSVLGKLSSAFARQGIDISNIVALAEYLSDENVVELLENAELDSLDEELLAKFVPLLDDAAKKAMLGKIFDGEMDWHFLKIILPYAEGMTSQVEAAVVEGVLPWDALELLREANRVIHKRYMEREW